MDCSRLGTSMDFFRQEHWSELPFPAPEDLPNPGIEPKSLAFQADSLPCEPPGKPLQRAWTLFRSGAIRDGISNMGRALTLRVYICSVTHAG